MKIYDYQPNTGEFLGEREARISPLDQHPLIPAYATDKEPPVEWDGFVRCFVDGVWKQVEDNRGKTAYSTATALPSVITAVGKIRDGYTTLVPCQYPKWDGTQWVTDIIAQEAAVALQNKINAKLADIATNLPSWSEISGEYEQLITDAQSAKNTENIKAVASTVIQTLRKLKKVERILYWLAKDSQI